jgi:hypothetical protein
MEFIGYIGLAEKKEAAQQTKHKTDIYLFIYLFIHNFSKIYVSFQILQIYTKPLYGMVFGSNLQPPYGTSNRCVIWQLGSVFSKNRNFFNELRWR